MHCSSSEALLDGYVDGELDLVRRARVARHLESCAACSALLDELRVIDALLLTPRTLEPAPNFSFKVMAEVRSMPPPHAHRDHHVAVLVAYVVFAWAAIGTFLVFGGASARAALATISNAFGATGSSLGALATATGRLFGRHSFDVTAAMGAILGLDLVAAAAVVALYAVLRARRSAVLESVEPC